MSIMQKVQSSNIEAIGYDKDEKILKVQFAGVGGVGGPIYEYSDVDPMIYDCLLKENDNGSVGKFVNKHIKPNYMYRLELSRKSLIKALTPIAVAKDLINRKDLIGAFAEGQYSILDELSKKFGLKL